jgi:hypothetical protein
MSRHGSQREIEGSRSRCFVVRGRLAFGWVVRTAAAAAVLAVLETGALWPIAAGNEGTQDRSNAPPAIPSELAGFLAEAGHRLKACHERIVRLGNPLLDSIRYNSPHDIDPDSQETRVEAAKAGLQGATLVREVAEMELKEYVDATVPQEQAKLEAQIAQARDDLNRAMRKRVVAIERLEKIKRLSTGSAPDLELEYRFENGGVVAGLEQNRARFGVELAASQLRLLKEFSKHQRSMELESKVKRALSEELAKRAELQMEQGKLNVLKREAQNKDVRSGDAELLRLFAAPLRSIDEAISIDGNVRGKLEQLAKSGKSDAGVQKEIRDSTNQLEALIDRAEVTGALSRFEYVKKSIEHTTGQRLRARTPSSVKPKRQDP